MKAFASKSLGGTELVKVSKETFLGVIWSGVITSFLFVIMRLVARWATFKRFWFDDVFVVFAFLLALGTAIDWQIVAWKMYGFISATSGQGLPSPPDFVVDTESYYDGSVAAPVFFYSSLWAVKLAFLLFFRRLGHNVKGQKLLWWSIFGLTVATYFVCIGNISYSCLVNSLSKIFATCSSDRYIQSQAVILKVDCAMDVVTDFLIMTIPINMLWRVQISVRKKLALTGIFSLVLVTMVIAIVRVAVISTFGLRTDTAWLYLWSSVEQCVAIVVSCLGSFRALFSRHDTSKLGPQRSLIHASRNIFLRGTKRRHPNDQSISLTELVSDPAPYSIYIRTGDSAQTGAHLNELEDGQARAFNNVMVESEVEVRYVDRRTQSLP